MGNHGIDRSQTLLALNVCRYSDYFWVLVLIFFDSYPKRLFIQLTDLVRIAKVSESFDWQSITTLTPFDLAQKTRGNDKFPLYYRP